MNSNVATSVCIFHNPSVWVPRNWKKIADNLSKLGVVSFELCVGINIGSISYILSRLSCLYMSYIQNHNAFHGNQTGFTISLL